MQILAALPAPRPYQTPPPQPPASPDPPPAPPAPPEHESRTTFWKRIARGITGGLQTLAKAPRLLLHIPSILRFAIVDAAIPLVSLTAGLAGSVAFVGVGACGVLETVEGFQEHDRVKIFSGCGEVSRGLFLGAVTAGSLLELGSYASLVGGLGVGFAYGHGLLSVASGVAKIRQGVREHNTQKKVVGLLDCSIAACTLLAVNGSFLGPALIAQGVLAGTRFIYEKHDDIIRLGRTAGRRVKEKWNDFKAIFRESPPTNAASGSGPGIAAPTTGARAHPDR